MKYDHKYDDIIDMEHHISKKHPQMSLYARSAQFAPFAALTGYEDAVKEISSETNFKIELDDEMKQIIDSKLQIILEKIKNKPEVTITYFIPDSKKDGGEYITKTGLVSKIDTFNHKIVLLDQTEIPINEIIDIEGNILRIC